MLRWDHVWALDAILNTRVNTAPEELRMRNSCQSLPTVSLVQPQYQKLRVAALADDGMATDSARWLLPVGSVTPVAGVPSCADHVPPWDRPADSTGFGAPPPTQGLNAPVSKSPLTTAWVGA